MQQRHDKAGGSAEDPPHDFAAGCALYLLRCPALYDTAALQHRDPVCDRQGISGVSRGVNHRTVLRHLAQGVQVMDEGAPAGG